MGTHRRFIKRAMAVANSARSLLSLQSLAASPASCQSLQLSASLFPLAPSRASLRQHRQTLPKAASSFLGTSLSAPVKQAYARRPLQGVRAEASEGAEPAKEPEVSNSLAPLSPSSPTGEFLVKMLQDHPHLFPSAADQQLERLATEKQEADSVASTSGSDLVLYERINQLKATERSKAVEDIIYALVVQRFVEAGAQLVCKVAPLTETAGGNADVGPLSFDALNAVHSPDALEMCQEHLNVVLGAGQTSYADESVSVQISKLRMGQVYAASVMYGYFLRRVDKRFQLEKTMKGLGADLGFNPLEALDAETGEQVTTSEEAESLAAEAARAAARMARGATDFEKEGSDEAKQGLNRLRANQERLAEERRSKLALRKYVLSFDAETLQQVARIRTRETLNVIEKHVEALFGKPEIVVGEGGVVGLVVPKDDAVKVSLAGLRKVVLEALAFGTHLWDVESYIEEQYNLVAA